MWSCIHSDTGHQFRMLPVEKYTQRLRGLLLLKPKVSRLSFFFTESPNLIGAMPVSFSAELRVFFRIGGFCFGNFLSADLSHTFLRLVV